MDDGKMKILFTGHDFKFINYIIDYYNNHHGYIVKVDKCNWMGSSKSGEIERKKLLSWADIIVTEWCLGNAVWYSKNKLPGQRLFIRLHRQEIETKFPRELILENINKIIFIAPYIQNRVENMINLPKNKSVLIYNGVDVDRFRLPKQGQSKFNIGMIGYCPKLKRLDRVIGVFEELKRIDDRYKLYIIGAHPTEYKWLWDREEERKYYKDIFNYINRSKYKESIIFEGWSSNVHEWLRKICFLLSTSDIEGSHQAVAESMSSGCMPFITGWRGADLLYPKEFVKKDIKEVVESIDFYTKDQKAYAKKREEAGAYCYEHFDIDVIIEQWNKLLSGD